MITVGFSTHPGLLSRLIRFVTRSRASHAWIVFDDRHFRVRFVLESTGKGFHLIPFERWGRSNAVVRTFDLPYPLEDGLAAVAGYLGESYDVGGLVGMVVVLAGRWLRRRWRNPLASSRTVFCSEAVTRILVGAGVPGAEELDPEATSPEDLLVFLETLNSPQSTVHSPQTSG